MTVREALYDYASAREFADAPRTFEDCYSSFWIWLRVGRWRVPIFPLRPFRNAVILHDLHHMVTGYETTWKGELEIAGWEIGSGGCAWHLYFWFDRLFFVIAGLVFAPRATLRAFRRGRGEYNLYREEAEAVLAMDLEELRARVAV